MPWSAAVAPLVASSVQSYADYRSQSIANSKSQKSANKAFWLDFWAQNYFMDKQNEYNKPINQMKRLEEAGLNPNLVYGSGADTLSASPSGGGASAVHFSPSKMSLDYIEKKHMLNSMKQQEANLERSYADTRAVNTNIDIAKAELHLREAETRARIKKINEETKWLENKVSIGNPESVIDTVSNWYDTINNKTYSWLEKTFGPRPRKR